MRSTVSSDAPNQVAAAGSWVPATLVTYAGTPIARIRSGTQPSVLPFDLASCTMSTVSAAETDVSPRDWALQAKVLIGLNAKASQHWVAVSSTKTSSQVCVAFSDTTAAGIRTLAGTLASSVADAFVEKSEALSNIRVFIMSEPVGEASDEIAFPPVASRLAQPSVNERVFLADTAQQLANLISSLLLAYFVEGQRTPTAVFSLNGLPFPVNIHSVSDALRRAEHEELLLPRKRLLHLEQAARGWETVGELTASRSCSDDVKHGQTAAAGVATGSPPCTGAAWEKHLVTNPHTELRQGPSPVIDGATTLLTTGEYDYYHYRVDGFRDDGWGCAYRSLQTILSWFQHEGLMTASMPSLLEIQSILSVVDPVKAGKKTFVGSSEWIGSFEIMLVLQHFMPNLECTIRRLESGAALDSDPVVQRQLFDHFRSEKASPVMIGGSSYAHTILGVHMNLETTEAQYLILDPHFSANPTNIKTAVNKGYVGWKHASKFFEASKWYNVCIPRVDLFDPR